MPTYTTRTDLMHLGIVVPSGNLIELDAETAERLGDKVSLVAQNAPEVKTPVSTKQPAADTGEPADSQTPDNDIDTGKPGTDQTDPDGSTLIGVAHIPPVDASLVHDLANPKPTSKTEKTK